GPQACARLARDGAQRLAQLRGLGRVQLDDEPTTALERHTHDDAPTLLGDLERSVTGPGLHGCHRRAPLSFSGGAADLARASGRRPARLQARAILRQVGRRAASPGPAAARTAAPW